MQVNEIFRPELFDDTYSKQLLTQFNTNQPIRHLVIDNFLEKDFANTINKNFPSIDEMRTHYKGVNEKKAEHSDFSRLHPSFEQLHRELSSGRLIAWLQKITGIDS